MYLESSVEYSSLSNFIECLWTANLSLNGVLQSPIYSIAGKDAGVTVALYTMFDAWQLPSRGQLALLFRVQLHEGSGEGADMTCLLWALMMDFTLPMHE